MSGKMAQHWLDDEDLKGETVVFLDGSDVYRKSSAALRALSNLGGIWKLAGLGLWAPRFLRDGLYDFIARRRRRWFGGGESCPLPTSVSGSADGRLLS